VIEYVTDQLLASAKRRARIPDAAFSPAELLAIASEELESYLVPLIASAHEDYYLTHADFTLSADAAQTYRIPSRAVGGGLRELSFLDVSGEPIDVPRISTDDLEQATWGFVIESQSVRYVNRVARSGPVTLRMAFPASPGLLCQAASAAVISAVNGTAVTLAAVASPADPLLPEPDPAAPTSMSGATSFDFLRATPGFELVAFDQAGACNGTTLTLGAAASGLLVGDYVTLAGQRPVPQCPTALFPVLAQSIAAEMLHQLGKDDEAQAALAKRTDMEARAKPLLQNRVKGAPQQIIRRHGVLQATRRW
jgi:hypothetical protein